MVILKNLLLQIYQSELISKLNSRSSCGYSSFKKSFIKVLDKHSPKMKKILRGNQKLHVNKTLRSAIMKRAQLRKQRYEI